jgi:hypothetical protein
MCQRIHQKGFRGNEGYRLLDAFRVDEWSEADVEFGSIMCALMAAMLNLAIA